MIILYKVQYSDNKYFNFIKNQEILIDKYISNCNNCFSLKEEENLLKDPKIFDRKIDKVIDAMKINDCLTVSYLEILGHSIGSLLKRIITIYRKQCSLYIIYDSITIDPFIISDTMRLLERLSNHNQILTSNKRISFNIALKSSGKKTGRKEGKKYKSKFDQYRSKIILMHTKGISKKKIAEAIGIGTPQAIGKYIKSLNEQKEKHPKKKKKETSFLSSGMLDPETLSERLQLKTDF